MVTKKRWTTTAVAALTIGLMLGLSQIAAAFEVSPGVTYQFGDFTYSLLGGEESDLGFSVPQPSIVWTVDAARGNFVGSAFYGARGVGPAGPNPDWWGVSEEDDVEAVGASRTLGADIGYRLSLGSCSVVPTVGYRKSEFWSGYTGTDGDEASMEYTEGFGLEVSGYRVGVEGIMPVGAKMAIRGSFGFGSGTHGRVILVEQVRDVETGVMDDYRYYEDIPDQTTSSSDYSISLTYELGDCLSVEAGYRAWSGSLAAADMPVDTLSFGSSAFFVKGAASF